MADFPGYPSRNLPIKEKPSTSIFPAAIAEAKGAKVTVSLFLLLAHLAGGYALGERSGRGVSKAEVKALETRLVALGGENLSLTRALDTTLKMLSSTVSAMDTRIHVLAGEVQVTKSKVEDCRR